MSIKYFIIGSTLIGAVCRRGGLSKGMCQYSPEDVSISRPSASCYIREHPRGHRVSIYQDLISNCPH